MSIPVYMPPDDYQHPPVDPIRRLNERVRDLVHNYGEGVIVAVHDNYINRADQQIERRNYRVEWSGGGVSMRFGYELELLPCSHKWVTFASGHQWKHQYCRSCGAEQRIDET